jgi:dethiobiotin synthetase
VKRWFITGTDTGIGKTHVACALARHLVNEGFRVAAMKPVASGCAPTPAGLRNDDALALMRAANVELPYGQVNPVALEPAIAPHIAAEQAGLAIDFERIEAAASTVDADYLLVEGVGGWCVPLGGGRMLAELARRLTDAVILVVGMRLGCINHALLTAAQIGNEGPPLLGWIANRVDPAMPAYPENLATLTAMMPAPLLATLDWTPAGDRPGACLPELGVREPSFC